MGRSDQPRYRRAFHLRDTWNLTTHRIDPDVDEARDYVVEDLLRPSGWKWRGYVNGIGVCDATLPRRNLTGDPYFTDGKRAAVVVSPARTQPRFVAWTVMRRTGASEWLVDERAKNSVPTW